MKKLMLLAGFVLPIFCIPSGAIECAPAVLFEQPFGYSSDEPAGSTSYLGVDTRDITPDRLTPLHLKDEQGVEVTMVDQDAPAGKAGIKEHDVIMSVNGDKVESVEQLRRLIREIPPGRVVTIGLSRNGQPIKLQAQLASHSQGFAFNGKSFHVEVPPIPAMPDFSEMDIPVSVVVVHSSMRSGLMVENLTPQLGDFFGIKNGQGILVRSVEKGSRAEKAGFHAGDVIVKVNGQAVADSGDFGRVLRSRKDNNVSIGVIRDKKEQTITLTLPDRKQSEELQESLKMPEISQNIEIDLSGMKTELAKIQPQIEYAVQQARKVTGNMKVEISRQQKVIEKQKEQIKLQTDKVRKQLIDQNRKLRMELHFSQADI